MNLSAEKLQKVNLLSRISNGEILLYDGAIGSMILAKNIEELPCPEYLNLSRIDIITEIANQYSVAGADIIQTNTFGASPLKLSDYNLDNKTEQINRNAVKAVRKIVKDHQFVSASIGPSGKILKPYGDTDEKEVYISYLEQVSILADEKVDVFCIETMTDINEALKALKAVKENAPGIPVIATMTFDKTPGGFYTVMGVTIEEAVNKLEGSGADIIGSNCGNGIENMTLIAREFIKYSRLPVIIQSNAGLPEVDSDGNVVYSETPEYMSEWITVLLKEGVSIIGGCCGTTPSHISKFRKIIDNYFSN